MRRGTKPQRAALKVIRGSLGTRRVPKFERRGISILDAPPAWMDETQRAQWFYAVQNAPPGPLTGTDREVLAVWVVACVEHARAAAEVRRTGQVVKAKDGNAVNNPYLGHRQSAGVHHDPHNRRTRLHTLGPRFARHDRGKGARRPALDRRGKSVR
jgi:phage terminase small subunit